MDAGTAGMDHRSFQYQRINAETPGSNIELSLCPPEEPSVIYHAPQNFQPFQSNISFVVELGKCPDTKKENIRMSTSSIKVLLNADSKFMDKFSWVIPKLVKHAWTEYVEFGEIWSDIPHKHINHNWVAYQDLKALEKYGISKVTDSNIDCSRGFFVLNKYPWTASTEFVELWSDIPREIDTNRNRFENREQLREQNVISSSYVTVPAEDMSDGNPYLATISGNLGGWTELGDCIEMGRLAPDEEPLCNPNHSDNPGSTREPLSLELFAYRIVKILHRFQLGV